MTARLWQRWRTYWFAPQEPTDLAVGRILFFGALFVLYLPVDVAAWTGVAPAFREPIVLFEMLGLPLLAPGVVAVLQVVWKLSLLLACVGFFTRTSTVVAAVLGLYLIGLPHNIVRTYHDDAVVVLVLAVLAVSRCGDAFSVDRWWRGRRGRAAAVPASGEYRWPVRTVWLILSLAFFAAGYAKLRNSGLAWITSENMAFILVSQQYGLTPLVDWGAALARSPWLYRPIAAATVLLEIGYPLAMVSWRARLVFVPGMIATQIGIRVLMGPSFEQFLVCSVFWVPWGALLAAPLVRRVLPGAAPAWARTTLRA